VVVRPSPAWRLVDFAELWRYRDLLFAFTWRNVLVRYKQTALGFLWAILQPLFLMVVLTIFFKHLGNASSNGLPYPLFAYSGLLPWTFFSTSLTQTAMSLVSNQNLLRKIYFPRVIIPFSTVLTALVDFTIAASILGFMFAYYGVAPVPVRLLALPALILLALVTALGVGLWLSALNVAYRDVQYAVPFIAQIWLFATPGVYTAAHFHGPLRILVGLNPMQGVVTGFRWALLDAASIETGALTVSIGVALVVLGSGLVFFRRFERKFADLV
jgi:lipopolysaccharide transport system permease protein